MKKFYFIIVSIMCCAMLFGCGEEKQNDITLVYVEKSGKITGSIVEKFDKDYYDAKELQDMVEEDMEAYNAKAGLEAVKLDQMNITDGLATAKVYYADGATYQSFNDVTFFYGTVSDAKEAGYLLEDVHWKNTNGEDATLKTEDHSDMKIVIFEEPIHVRTYGNIAYLSENAVLMNKKEAAVENDDEQLAYLLFK